MELPCKSPKWVVLMALVPMITSRELNIWHGFHCARPTNPAHDRHPHTPLQAEPFHAVQGPLLNTRSRRHGCHGSPTAPLVRGLDSMVLPKRWMEDMPHLQESHMLWEHQTQTTLATSSTPPTRLTAAGSQPPAASPPIMLTPSADHLLAVDRSCSCSALSTVLG